MDIIIPIVFPDYKIQIQTSRQDFDLIPYFEFDNFSVPAISEKLPNLGHAGLLIVNGKTGITKYYEYGRYDKENKGIVRKIANLPNAKMTNGKLNISSLNEVFRMISRTSGHSGRIQGAWIEVDSKFLTIQSYAESRKSLNSSSSRRPYHVLTNSCIHFVKDALESAGIATPWMLDPRPNSYIGEFRSGLPDLDFDGNNTRIEGKGRF